MEGRERNAASWTLIAVQCISEGRSNIAWNPVGRPTTRASTAVSTFVRILLRKSPIQSPANFFPSGIGSHPGDWFEISLNKMVSRSVGKGVGHGGGVRKKAVRKKSLSNLSIRPHAQHTPCSLKSAKQISLAVQRRSVINAATNCARSAANSARRSSFRGVSDTPVSPTSIAIDQWYPTVV